MIFTSTEVDVKKCSTINSIFIFSLGPLGKTATLPDMSLRTLKPVILIQSRFHPVCESRFDTTSSTDSDTENSITSFVHEKEKHLW